MTSIKFSIITAVWNREATLGHALDSLAAQTYENFEHLVQDGGSTDNTLALLESRPDPRRRLISRQDNGIYDALNRAMARASGDVFGLLHSDDFLAHPEVLARVVQHFNETGADAVYGDLDYVSADDPTRIVRHWRSGEFQPSKLRCGWMPPHPALFLRRKVIETWGGYDTSYSISADYDFILRCFAKGKITAAWLPEVLVKMRLGGESNRSLERMMRKSCEDYRALRQNQVGGIGALASKSLRKVCQFFVRS